MSFSARSFTIPRRARRASRGLPTSYAAAPLNRLIMRNIPLHLDQRRGATQPLPELSRVIKAKRANRSQIDFFIGSPCQDRWSCLIQGRLRHHLNCAPRGRAFNVDELDISRTHRETDGHGRHAWRVFTDRSELVSGQYFWRRTRTKTGRVHR